MTKVLLVGVGLINGSFSLSLKDRKELTFGGCDLLEDHLVKAKEKGVISEVFSLEEGIKWADVILLGVPVNVIKKMLPKVLDSISEEQLVVDFGSTKETICNAVKDHPKRKNFLAAHPIAGTEHSGPTASFSSLFKGQNLIICEKEKSESELASKFIEIAKDAGFYFTYMSAQEHDRHLAYISHLSHISSYVLSNTVLQKEKDGEVILDLAGSGFESTVRLAKSSPAMWSSIFKENKQMVLESINAYQKELSSLKEMIDNEEVAAMRHYLEEGREIRRILK